ncbi:MAG: hypothetical protein J6R79_02650 [Bacteroidaceae bacterium]|nr:hypothetical protein [Bacteroidaceae bacterium]
MNAFFEDINNNKKSAVNDFLTYIGYPYPDDLVREDNPLWLLGIPPFSAETHLFVVDLFLKLVKESNWSDCDKRIWIDRYVLNKPPKNVAKRVKSTSVWVNGRFYRCKQKLARMVRSWWNERLTDSPDINLPILFNEYIKEQCRKIK